MFGVSAEQNDKVLKKDLWVAIKEDETYAWLYSDKSCKSYKVTFQQIQKYEKGVNAVSIMNELKLAEFLKCDRNYFVQPITENGYKF